MKTNEHNVNKKERDVMQKVKIYSGVAETRVWTDQSTLCSSIVWRWTVRLVSAGYESEKVLRVLDKFLSMGLDKTIGEVEVEAAAIFYFVDHYLHFVWFQNVTQKHCSMTSLKIPFL